MRLVARFSFEKKLWPFIYIVLLHRASAALSNSFLSLSLFLFVGVPAGWNGSIATIKKHIYNNKCVMFVRYVRMYICARERYME